MDEAPGNPRRTRGVSRTDPEGTASGGRLDDFVAAMPEPVLVANASGTVVTANDGVSDVFGRGAATLRGEQLDALFSGLGRADVAASVDGGVGEYVTCRAVRADGPDPWVELAFERQRVGGRSLVVCVVHDVTAHHERERSLEQYERIVETINDGVYVLDESFTIETVNSAVESMTGYSEDELVGENATLLADESVIEQAVTLSEELVSGDRDVATLTADLRTAEGDLLPVETRFTTYPLADGDHGYVGVIRDISDRREFERTLAALHDATRSLLEVESSAEVDRLVVESALDVLDVARAAVYRFDREENVLRPTFVAGSNADDDASVVTPPDGPLWEAFVEGEVMTADRDGTGKEDGSVPRDICLPLGAYGVFAVAAGDDGYDADTVEVLAMLAASAEAVLARLSREKALWKRDEELQERNRQLRRHKEVNAIIRRIDQVLVDADTREEIEQAVCDQLAASHWISFAWIGRLDTTDLTPQAWAGDSPDYLDAVSLSTAGDGGPPAVRTARTDSMTVVPSITERIQDERWRVEAVSRDFQSATSVPLQAGEFTYGVLTVYGTEPSAFEEMVQSVFTELGDTIANAIREVESRQHRSAPTEVELELSLSAPTSPLAQLSARLGSPVVCEGAVPEEGDATRLFIRTGTDPDTVGEHTGELTRVESLTPITGDGDTPLFEAVVSGGTVGGTLLDCGARIDSVRAEPDAEGTLAVTVRLPTAVDVRAFVERLDEKYGGARLEARRERTVSDRTPSGVRTALAEALTDRQLQVLRTAYLSGFFDWPRESSGAELADRLDVTQPTMSRHLRVSERKLLEIVFEDRSTGGSSTH